MRLTASRNSDSSMTDDDQRPNETAGQGGKVGMWTEADSHGRVMTGPREVSYSVGGFSAARSTVNGNAGTPMATSSTVGQGEER